MLLVPVFQVLLAAEGFLIQVNGILLGNIDFAVFALHHILTVDSFSVTGFGCGNEAPD
jgi:hypothetical protein